MRTNQEVFDSVMKWLTRDGASRCVREEVFGREVCVYYNPVNENRCAIGGDLPLEFAKKLGHAAVGIGGICTNRPWEEEGESFVPEDLAKSIIEYYNGVSPELLNELQRLHDDKNNWGAEGFIGHSTAAEIANSYGLVY